MELIHDGEAGYTAWNKLFARDLFNYFRYPTGRIHEDIGTSYKAVDKAKRIFYSHASLYNYTALRPGSLTEKATREEQRDWLIMWSIERNDLKKLGYKKCTYLMDEAFKKLIRYERAEGLSTDFKSTIRLFMKTSDGFSGEQARLLSIYKLSPHLFDFICNSDRALNKLGIHID